jgi:MFS family permease
MTARTEPTWLVVGSFGIALTAFGVGFAPLFPIALVSLFVMGTCDGLTIVSENGIMQRRTPDAIRSRTMAAFEAMLSLGLVVAYLLAGPVLSAVGPRWVYRIAGISSAAAALMLLPLLRLRSADEPEPVAPGVPEPVAHDVPIPPADALIGPDRAG